MERTAIVTGGTGGLGRRGDAHAARRRLARRRAVVRGARSSTRVDEHERLDLVQADLTDPASAAEVVDARGRRPAARSSTSSGGSPRATRARDAGRRLRAAPAPQPPPDLPDERRGAARDAARRAAARSCASRRAPRCSRSPARRGYITAKAAVLAFVDVLARRVPRRRHPHQRDHALDHRHARQPRGPARRRPRRVGHAGGDRAASSRYLCSDDAGVTSGAHIPVYGRA